MAETPSSKATGRTSESINRRLDLREEDRTAEILLPLREKVANCGAKELPGERIAGDL